jgi:hypothetical protein
VVRWRVHVEVSYKNVCEGGRAVYFSFFVEFFFETFHPSTRHHQIVHNMTRRIHVTHTINVHRNTCTLQHIHDVNTHVRSELAIHECTRRTHDVLLWRVRRKHIFFFFRFFCTGETDTNTVTSASTRRTHAIKKFTQYKLHVTIKILSIYTMNTYVVMCRF